MSLSQLVVEAPTDSKAMSLAIRVMLWVVFAQVGMLVAGAIYAFCN